MFVCMIDVSLCLDIGKACRVNISNDRHVMHMLKFVSYCEVTSKLDKVK